MATAKTKAKKGKSAPKKPKAETKPKKVVEVKPEETVEMVEDSCSCGCEGEHEHDPIMKNPMRSYVLRDIWYEGLNQVIEEEAAPEDNKKEMLFLTLSNALLDMVMDIVPADVGEILAENIDDFLCITMVNRENDLDLLQKFKEDFVIEKGDTFEDEIELQEALSEFEEIWWNKERKDLGDKSPNEAIADVAERYDL
jgi:hypothetical protein